MPDGWLPGLQPYESFYRSLRRRTMKQQSQLLAFIQMIYECVDSPDGFVALLEAMSQAHGLEVLGISSMGRQEDVFATVSSAGADDSHILEYAERIAHVDPHTASALALPYGHAVIAGASVVPRRALVKTEFYDWLQRLGAEDVLLAGHKTRERGMLGLAGFTSKGVRATDEHIESWTLLTPHLFHAVSISRQITELKSERRMAREALDRADFGCVFFDQNARVEWMNEHAERILEGTDGMELLGDGSLRVSDRRSRTIFEQALRAALGVSGGELCEIRPILEIHRHGGRRPLEVLLSPRIYETKELFGVRRGAMMIFADPEFVDEQFAERLLRLYALTPTEAEIAQWLLSGTSVNQIAEIFGNSVHTVRTHVKSILRKCQVSSQVELVGLLQRSLARLA